MSDPYPDRTGGDDSDHLVETPESMRDSDPEALPVDRDEDAGEHRLYAEGYGTTNEEEELGESLDQRLAQEEPDVADTGGADRSGDADVARDGGAEQAAMHVVDDN
jgi:hypothetical protein